MNPGPLNHNLPERPCAACGGSFKPNTAFTMNCKRQECIRERGRRSVEKCARALERSP